MKTADRILSVSLDLFNFHGEANMSSVDIALELDISPGNLYYHFKGKEIIISSLFDMYQQRMTKLLAAPENQSLTLEEFFYYLLLIFKVSHEYRFFYRNPAEIAEKYPQIAKGFQRILVAKEKVIALCIENFKQQSLLIIGDKLQLQQMVELVGLVSTQSPNYQLLKGKDINDGEYVYQSLATILFALAPYMNISKDNFTELYKTIVSHQIDI